MPPPSAQMSSHPSSPVTGRDETGQLLLTVDRDNRVVSAHLASVPDSLRRPEALAGAVDRAHRQATLMLVAGRPDRPAGRQGARTARTRTSPPPRPAMNADPDRRPDLTILDDLGDPRSPRLRAEGESANGCVRVHLLPASSRATLEVVESGWLTQASGREIANAITQAFTAAYEARSAR